MYLPSQEQLVEQRRREGAWCLFSGCLELPAVFAAVIVEQKRLKLHEFPFLYRRKNQHVLSIDPMCWAQHRGWMWDGVDLGSADWKRPPQRLRHRAGSFSSFSGSPAGA